jgi:hypothetical protein
VFTYSQTEKTKCEWSAQHAQPGHRLQWTHWLMANKQDTQCRAPTASIKRIHLTCNGLTTGFHAQDIQHSTWLYIRPVIHLQFYSQKKHGYVNTQGTITWLVRVNASQTRETRIMQYIIGLYIRMIKNTFSPYLWSEVCVCLYLGFSKHNQCRINECYIDDFIHRNA